MVCSCSEFIEFPKYVGEHENGKHMEPATPFGFVRALAIEKTIVKHSAIGTFLFVFHVFLNIGGFD